MGELAENTEDLQAVEMENAKLDSIIKNLDIRLKEFELHHKPGFWKGVLASPAFLAAVIAVSATLGTASVSWIIASQQRTLEEAKSAANLNLEWVKFQTGLLSQIVLAKKPGESCAIAEQLSTYLGAQVITGPSILDEAKRMHKFYSDQCNRFGH